MYAIPTWGRSVPIPGTRKLLPTVGQNIGPLTQYWLRRLRDGDITVSPTAPTSSSTQGAFASSSQSGAATPSVTSPASASSMASAPVEESPPGGHDTGAAGAPSSEGTSP